MKKEEGRGMRHKRCSFMMIAMLSIIIQLSLCPGLNQAAGYEREERRDLGERFKIEVDLEELGFFGSVKEVVDVETYDRIEVSQKGSDICLETAVQPAQVKILKLVLNDPEWKDNRSRRVRPVVPNGDVYKRVNGDEIILGNSKIEIRFNKENGAIVNLINKQTKTSYLTGKNPNSFVLYYSREADIWKAKEYINPREGRTKVTSEVIQGKDQVLHSYAFAEKEDLMTLRLRYSTLKGSGKAFKIAIEQVITMRSNDELTQWNLIIDNRDRGTIISAIFPMFSDLQRLSEDDYYIGTQGYGFMIPDPLSQLSKRFYSMPDEQCPLGRQWHEYGNKREGLYLAAYDRDIIYKTFNFGNRQGKGIYSGKRNPLNRGINSKAEMSIKTYCFVGPGKRWESFDYMFGIHRGDWHWSADRYREWFLTWAKTPKVPHWYKENFDLAFVGIIGQSNHVECRYEEMKNKYKRKNMMLFWYGWNKGWLDTFPEYDPIPLSQFSWGGRENLEKAIKEIHKLGGRVGLYTNAHIISIGSKIYENTGGNFDQRKHGSWDAIGRNEIPYYELYEGKIFVVPCPFVKEWQDVYLKYIKKIPQFGADGMQLDQIGLNMPQLCYKKSHGHPTPANGPAIGTLKFLKRIREKVKRINPDFVLYPEFHSDAFIQYTDDAGGWCCGDYGRHVCEETGLTVINLPEIYRYTLPEYPRIHQDPTKTPNRYAYPFILGNRFSPDPDFREYYKIVDHYSTIAKRGSGYFIDGKFMDTIGLTVSDPGIVGKVHLSKNRDSFIIALWNPGVKSEFGIESEEKGREIEGEEEIHTQTRITEDMAISIAKKDIRIQRLISKYPGITINSYFLGQYGVWRVEFYVGEDNIVSASISDETGKVMEVEISEVKSKKNLQEE